MTFDEFMDARLLGEHFSLRMIIGEWADDEFADSEEHIKHIEKVLRKNWPEYASITENTKPHARY